MKVEQKAEFKDWLKYFFKNRHNVELHRDIVEDWWDDLKNFSFDDIKDAFVLHRRDEKLGSFQPKVNQILKFIKKPQSSGYKPRCDHCSSDAKFCFEQENGAYIKICLEHYEAAREKTEIDLELEKIEGEFISQAKKLDLKNRDFFALKNPKLAEAFCKNENMATKRNGYKFTSINPPKSVKFFTELIGA